MSNAIVRVIRNVRPFIAIGCTDHIVTEANLRMVRFRVPRDSLGSVN